MQCGRWYAEPTFRVEQVLKVSATLKLLRICLESSVLNKTRVARVETVRCTWDIESELRQEEL